MGETLGASFQIDVSNLKAGLAQANRLVKESNSQFKAAAAGMGDWTKSQDGLTAKIKNLNDVANIQQKKVEALQSEYERLIADGLDPTSAAAVKLRTQINNEKAALAQTQSEITKYSSALDEMKASANENISASQKLKNEISSQQTKLDELKSKYQDVVLEQGKNSQAAKNLAKDISALNSDLSSNKRKLDESKISLDDAAKASKDSGDGFTVAKGAVATFIGNGLNKLVDAAKNAVSSLLGLADETREFRQDLNTLTTAYDEAGFSTAQATETWKELYGVFGEDDRAVEAANNIARMSKSQEELNMWTKITTGVWGTYQDALPVESLAEAAGETAKVGQVTGVMADALNWSSDAAQMFAQYMGGDVTTAEDAFNVALSECTSEQERQTLVTDTLTALYGDAADTYRDTAGSVIEANKATADLTLSQASLGEKVEPVTTSIKDGFSGILDKILELTGSPDLQGFADNIDSAFSSFTDETLPSIMDGINDFKDNLPAVGVAIGGVTAAMIAFKVAALSAKLAEEGLTIATKLQAVAQGLLNAVMNANPIGLVILAITALITIFMVLWNKCEWFRNFWIGLWDKIKSAASAVADWLPQAFSRAVDGIKNVFSGIGDFFGGLWDKIKERFSTVGTKIGEAIGGAFKKAINSVIATVEKGINFIPNSINKMLGAINKLPGVNISPIQTVSLPRLAKGGVVNRATTALIGEDGAEAVIPLERNRQWIKEVAKEFAAQGNQNKNVVVNQTNNYSQAHSRYEIWKSEKATVNAVKLALKEV
jgi:phage-related protein